MTRISLALEIVRESNKGRCVKDDKKISELIIHLACKALDCNPQPTYLGNFKIQPLSAVTIKSLQNVMESNLTPLNLHTLIKKALTDLTMFLIHYLKTQDVPRLKNSTHWCGGEREERKSREAAEAALRNIMRCKFVFVIIPLTPHTRL